MIKHVKILPYSWRTCAFVFGLLGAAMIAAADPAVQLPDRIEFNRDVRPILSDTCFKCHGFDPGSRKADLRLDRREEALIRRDDDTTPIVPGKPLESSIYQRLITDDRTELMPPPRAKIPLSPRQIAIIKKWIGQGAEYEPHWAYLPVKAPALPAVNEANAKLVRNPIDRFILARLEREGLSPSAQATNEKLIRRVTLDLTGLPPTPEEVAAFLKECEEENRGEPGARTAVPLIPDTRYPTPAAYSRLVDRLLASPAYGERMAWDWLDAARYADSNGYQGDGERTMWPWRDWVVSAFNRNMPYDQFTIEQIAGDLLPADEISNFKSQISNLKSEISNPHAIPPNPQSAIRNPKSPWLPTTSFERKLATGFNRNHMINGEGGRIAEENRIEYVFDQSETVGTVWLGLTFNCCRCHDHKFDPLSQKDYYSLFAFFDQTPVTGGGGDPATPPNLEVLSDAQRERIALLESNINKLNASFSERQKELAAANHRREAEALKELDKEPWHILKPTAMKAVHQELKSLDDESILAHGPNPANDTYTLTFASSPLRITGLRLEALRHESMTHGGIARSDSGNFVLTEIEVRIVPQDPPADSSIAKLPVIRIASANATYEQGNFKIGTAFDGKPGTGWAIWEGKPVNRDHEAVFRFAQPIALKDGETLSITLRHDSPHASHNLGRFRLSITDTAKPSLTPGNQQLVDALKTPGNKRNPQQMKLVADHLKVQDEPSRKLGEEIEKARKSLADLRKGAVKVMIMQDMASPRKTFMLDKGIYTSRLAEVTAATPGVLPPMAEGEPRNRLGLARWLVAPENPLMARVTINRLWAQFMGIGLVKTIEDFGIQSELPIHQELLDWLAAEFVRSGWDVKHMVKLIVTSHAYRQSSKVTPQLLERDPDNRLLARAPRYRMPSWMIRDQALAAGGLLVNRVGGPPVKPYQPAGIWEEATFGTKKYVQDKGEALYRRSIYIFWRRIVGPTMFFDTAARQICTVKQLRTNSPLHALTTLNDIAYVEAARAMAQRVILTAGDDRQARIDLAYRLALSRSAGAEEKSILTAAIERVRKEFAADLEGAKKLLKTGESPRDEKIDAVEHATWTVICNLILNLDEALTKE